MNEPDQWLDELSPLPAGARLFERASDPLDVIVYFSDERANVQRRVPVFAGFLAAGGVLWSAVPDSPETATRDDVERAGRSGGLVATGTLAIAPGWVATRLSREGAPPTG